MLFVLASMYVFMHIVFASVSVCVCVCLCDCVCFVLVSCVFVRL